MLNLALVFNAILNSVLSSFAIILLRKTELVALLKLCPCCRVTVSVLCLFLAVPWVGLWSVIVAFPGHTHLLFEPFSFTSAMFLYLYLSRSFTNLSIMKKSNLGRKKS